MKTLFININYAGLYLKGLTLIMRSLKFNFIMFLILFEILILLTGCDGSDNLNKEALGEASKFEVSFIDDDGNEINLDKPAERIISLYSAHTENLYYLGAGEKVIGRHKTCTYPPDAALAEVFDYNGDPEKVISANPDLVIIRPFIRKKVPDFVKVIESSGIKVVSLYPDKFDKFDEYIKKLAMITGMEENAQKLLLEFHKELDDIKSITSGISPKQTLFFESTETNVRTITSDSMAGIAIESAGGINIAKDAKPLEEGSSIADFGEEKVLMNADKIDVYISQRGSMNSGASKQGISERAGFDIINAIKNGRFFTINEKIISSPTFRYTKGVREIARYLYPEIMNDLSEYKNDNTATRRDFANIIFRYKNLPVVVPSSSSYYETERKGHTFGLFNDINWRDKDFDAIEASVLAGYVEGTKDNGKEYFYPDNNVTRDELAQTVFVMGNFSSKDKKVEIQDIDESEHKNIVRTLVENGVFELRDGKFEPDRKVSCLEIIKAFEKIDTRR